MLDKIYSLTRRVYFYIQIFKWIKIKSYSILSWRTS